MKCSTILWPGTRSRSSPIQFRGHSGRSWHQGNSAGGDDPGQSGFNTMQVIRVLNECQYFPGFVYEPACFSDDGQSILISDPAA